MTPYPPPRIVPNSSLNFKAFIYLFIFINVGVRVTLRTPRLINLTSPKINDHVSLQ
jgi:hypothetical protein